MEGMHSVIRNAHQSKPKFAGFYGGRSICENTESLKCETQIHNHASSYRSDLRKFSNFLRLLLLSTKHACPSGGVSCFLQFALTHRWKNHPLLVGYRGVKNETFL